MSLISILAKKLGKAALTGSGQRGGTLGERAGAMAVQKVRQHLKKRGASGSAVGASHTPSQKQPGATSPIRPSASVTSQQAVEQLGDVGRRSLQEVGKKVDKSSASMGEATTAMGVEVVSALKELEKSLVGRASRPRGGSTTTPPSGGQTGQTQTDTGDGEDKDSPISNVLKKTGALAMLRMLGMGVAIVGAEAALVQLGGKMVVPPRPAVKGSPAWWMGIDPTESMADRKKRLASGKSVDPGKYSDAPPTHMLGDIAGVLGGLFSAKGWSNGGKSTTAKTLSFKARRMEFQFKSVGGGLAATEGGGGAGGSAYQGSTDETEDRGLEQAMPGDGPFGARDEDLPSPSAPSDGTSPSSPQPRAGLKDLSQPQPLSEKKPEPAATGGPRSDAGTRFSQPTADPASRGLTGGKADTSSLIKSDDVPDFWKQRNPRGAKVYDKNGKPMVNEQLLHSEAAGIKAFEEKHPEYRVEMYGPSSGERTSGSVANHGDQRDGKGGALDVVIVDKKTGRHLTNHPGPNHQDLGTVGQNAATYQELFNDTTVAASKLYPGSEKDYRYGGYFASGDNAMDLMHTDVRSREAPMGGGSREGGFTPAQMKRWGITGNQGLGDDIAGQGATRYDQAPTGVSTIKMPGKEFRNPGFAAPVQSQGSFTQQPPPADVEPEKKVVVKPAKDDGDHSKGDRVRKKKFRETGGDSGATQVEKLRFSQYLNVENDEEQ